MTDDYDRKAEEDRRAFHKGWLAQKRRERKENAVILAILILPVVALFAAVWWL